MVLTHEEESLIQLVRTLPPSEASKVVKWISQVADLAEGRQFEWSDEWTAEDLADVSAASLRRFEEDETEHA